MLRVVIDTNVFVSGLLSRTGASVQVLDAWRRRKFLLITSVDIIYEVRAVLTESILPQKYKLSDKDVGDLIALLERDALIVPGQADVHGALMEDPEDEMFLASALDGQADFIVSGDHHLLDLVEYHRIPILTIQQFLDELVRN